jgi:hypothetical protein
MCREWTLLLAIAGSATPSAAQGRRRRSLQPFKRARRHAVLSAARLHGVAPVGGIRQLHRQGMKFATQEKGAARSAVRLIS